MPKIDLNMGFVEAYANLYAVLNTFPKAKAFLVERVDTIQLNPHAAVPFPVRLSTHAPTK